MSGSNYGDHHSAAQCTVHSGSSLEYARVCRMMNWPEYVSPLPRRTWRRAGKKVAEKLSASIIHERLRSFGNIWFINANAMVRWASLQIPSDQKSKSRIFAGLSRNGGGALWKYSLSQNYPGAYGGLAM